MNYEPIDTSYRNEKEIEGGSGISQKNKESRQRRHRFADF
jgi:hypothetical protein